jgi:hypothetical protein
LDDNNDVVMAVVDDIILRSANAEATCKHKVGVNSIACFGDNIAPQKGCTFVVNRVIGAEVDTGRNVVPDNDVVVVDVADAAVM